jgi:hypothetical protein
VLTWFLSWVLDTVATAADAEMNDDTVLREQLLEAEMRREMGEISDEEFAEFEADVLARIREIKERREGGSGPLAFGAGEPLDTTGDNALQVEASVSGDFHDPADAPHTTIIETTPAEGEILQTSGERAISVMDMEPGPVDRRRPGPRMRRRTRTTGTARTTRTSKLQK